MACKRSPAVAVRRVMTVWGRPALVGGVAALALGIGAVVLVAVVVDDGASQRALDASATASPTAMPGSTPSAGNPAPVWTIEQVDGNRTTVSAYRDGELLCVSVERTALRPEAYLRACIHTGAAVPPVVSAEVMAPGLVMGVVTNPAATVEIIELVNPADPATAFTYEPVVIALPPSLGVDWGVWIGASEQWWGVRTFYPNGPGPSIVGFDLQEQISHRFDFEYEFCGSHFIFYPSVAGPDCAPAYFATIGRKAERLQGGTKGALTGHVVDAEGHLCSEPPYTYRAQQAPDGRATLCSTRAIGLSGEGDGRRLR